MNAIASGAQLARPGFIPGIFEDMPAETYHAIEALSASGAKKMIRSPQHYKLMRDRPAESTEAMRFGTAVHAGVLEPDTFGRAVVCAPEVNRRTAAGKEEWSAFQAMNAGATILDTESFDRCLRCIDAVLAHPAARELLAGSRREVSALWYDGTFGVPCKCRYDLLNHGGIGDVKTTMDASAAEFARQAASLLYNLQAAAYNSGHEHALDASMGFFAFICVEKEPPHAVAVYDIPAAAVRVGAQLWETALKRYAAALKTGQWAGYPETIETLQWPRWALTHPA